MDISEAVKWWEEWQLRILVLSSLFLQFFLLISASLRKFRIAPWFRFFIWLAYLGSDALAIYALATLFNRHKKQDWISTHDSSVVLEMLWAPILLMHLGGRDGITAYNIEDNELWRRHVLTTVCQVTIAIYVFFKSWSGDKRLLQVAIFLFIPGILKCIEKPWALKNASITSVVSLSQKKKNSLASSFDLDEHDGVDEINSLEEYVQAATEYCEGIQDDESPPGQDDQPPPGQDDQPPPSQDDQPPPGQDDQPPPGQDDQPPLHHKVDDEPYNLFVDLSLSYSDRLSNLKYMVHNQEEAHHLVQSGLSATFDRLYTKDEVYKGIKIFCDCSWKGWFGQLLREAVGYSSIAAIVLFHKSHKEVYNDTDVKVTFILLYCTVALETISLQSFFDTLAFLERKPWPGQVAQYNLIWYFARNKKHSWIKKLATLLVCNDYLDQLWCMEPCKSSKDITKLVHYHVTDGWKLYIGDIASYRAFNDIRGQWTLQDKKCNNLEWSVRRPFDESVLLWHIATDFCFHAARARDVRRTTRRCRKMSNYMVYLLFVNPEMLMTGTRRDLFRTAYGELKHVLKDDEKIPLDEGELMQKIIEQMKKGTQGPGIIRDAWVLAEGLMGVGMEKGGSTMWGLIQGVWVEMLCFSAGRCRGYLHAKNLGKGGEYLSYVWLLMSHMGMETLAERMQRTELPEGDMGGAAPMPTAPIPTAPSTAGGDNNV